MTGSQIVCQNWRPLLCSHSSPACFLSDLLSLEISRQFSKKLSLADLKPSLLFYVSIQAFSQVSFWSFYESAPSGPSPLVLKRQRAHTFPFNTVKELRDLPASVKHSQSTRCVGPHPEITISPGPGLAVSQADPELRNLLPLYQSAFVFFWQTGSLTPLFYSFRFVKPSYDSHCILTFYIAEKLYISRLVFFRVSLF